MLDTSIMNVVLGDSIEIQYCGLGDWNFVNAYVDVKKTSVEIKVKAGQPHVYFGHDVYASITVLNNSGTQILHKDFIGDNQYNAEDFPVDFKEGYKLILFHREPSREKIVDTQGNVVSQHSMYNVFTIKEGKLVKLTYEFIMLGYYDRAVADVTVDINAGQVIVSRAAGQPHALYGDQVYASITILNDKGEKEYYTEYVGNVDYPASEEKLEFREGYRIILHHVENSHRLQMIDNYGKVTHLRSVDNVYMVLNADLVKLNYEFAFLGLGDWRFACANFNPKDGNLNVKIETGKPHVYFVKTAYASITIKDEKENIAFCQTFIGDALYNEHEVDLTLKENYKLIVEHQEPSRLKIWSNETDTKIPANKVNTFLYKGGKLIEQP